MAYEVAPTPITTIHMRSISSPSPAIINSNRIIAASAMRVSLAHISQASPFGLGRPCEANSCSACFKGPSASAIICVPSVSRCDHDGTNTTARFPALGTAAKRSILERGHRQHLVADQLPDFGNNGALYQFIVDNQKPGQISQTRCLSCTADTTVLHLRFCLCLLDSI